MSFSGMSPDDVSLFRALADHSADMVVILQGGRVMYANPACERIMGYTLAEVREKGFGIDVFFAEESRQLALENYGKRLSGEEVPPVEYVLLTREGRRLEAVVDSWLVTFQGAPAILARITDLTEQKQVRRQSLEHEQLFHTLAFQSPNMIFIHDGRRMVFANPRCSEIMGYSVEELTRDGFDFFTLATPETRDEARRVAALRLQGHDLGAQKYTLVTREGRQIDVLMNASRIAYEGRPALLVIVTDVTQLTSQAERLRESEEKFRLLAEQSLMGVGLIQDGIIVHANQAFCDLTGFSFEELHSWPAMGFSRFIHPDDRAMVLEEYRKKDVGDPTARPRYVYRVIRKDGAIMWVDMFAKNIQFMGRVARLVTLLDITQQKVAEENLRESESKFRVIFAESPVSLWIEDVSAIEAYLDEIRSGGVTDFSRYFAEHPREVMACLSRLRVIDVNQATLRLFAARDKEELTTHFDQAMTAEAMAVFARFLVDLAEARSEDSAEVMFRTLKGDTIFTDLRWTRREALSPGERLVLLSMTDITRRKALEHEQVRNRNLESLGVLAGGIAHDFNNLHTALFGNLELARLTCEPGTRMEKFLSDAARASERAQRLTRQLLTFARGGSPLKETVRLEEIIGTAVQFSLSGSAIVCEMDLPEDLWSVTVDRGQMDQVFSNLAINARDAMPGGGLLRLRGENVTVGAGEVAGLKPGRYVRVTVEDEGVGIPKEFIDRIFDPYFTTKGLGENKGTGLGLSICHSIMTKHEGQIGVRSEVGRGTTFVLHVPASPLPRETEARSHPAPRTMVRFKGRVLVMDDEPALLRVASEMLEHLGFDVTTALKGEEAIERFEEARKENRGYDLVILDLTVKGGMGGIETLNRLRKLDEGIRAIVASGYVEDPVMADHDLYGFCAALSKPFTIELLARGIESAGCRRAG